ncbi:hypothetical protein COW36_09480 [bacterium (Candidatus Blackallbacteria) CG17_big_fil_post_rev_8_21_14_2_50_48_46]|uniref:Methyltransferase FkbM domain-containing protein n=1 Tax=bacterium (Candidatus Blackallbacteria) CG17_big_fil_post_rev_8_21_14_2_50_48_46 TaxID=2014261 RepID=A0A2M7G5C4_9BACT|nr:MAG: hypothetical protein COW64_01930 [bacterium (Candidatus Blackallbacteria) CG18_big_fil_WC_8_21_14_2_50_49_26]PIW17194.1 MAG: hypothetical protein COW36_09480 [bacterium (Candidatus Blackallbacteria) CG17_big_fil_post_rev_8_21_14_2_50_48_46]PIW50985.1 MAG: hypothetical protein COW20_00490 [bacterium (Candidatus Blackallbacteria) CG13_big_fil_rev_8_21_14_2_50_49_14]
MTLISENNGIYFFSVPSPDRTVVLPHAENIMVICNESTQYCLHSSQVKELIFDSTLPRQAIPSSNLEKLSEIFSQLGISLGCFVDIGAYDGLNYSNTYPLMCAGWSGLMLECDPCRFTTLAEICRDYPAVQVSRAKVSPKNILAHLASAEIPIEFDFLSLDIDSYDYFVLEALLDRYHPTVICAEVNEVIPPPIEFTVKYRPDFSLDLSSRFFGMSLTKLAKLANRHGYLLAHMHYMDVILIDARFAIKDPENLSAFYKRSFLDLPRPTYYQDYPFDVEALLNAPPEVGLQILLNSFSPFQGQFELSLSTEGFALS